LWYTPVSWFPRTIPASFVCEVCCFTEPEDAAVVGAGVLEGEEVGVGFAKLGVLAGVAVAGGLSVMLDCGASASGPEETCSAHSHERSHGQSTRLRVTVHRFAYHRNARPRKPRRAEFRHDGEESG
jgi:hypothetical protein